MKNIARTLASVLVLTYTASALAQASCSSDGIPQPVAIFERFISADCEACWADPAAPAPSATTTVVLDWIVPSALGDDAPLSAAATSDAVQRLQALGRPAPASLTSIRLLRFWKSYTPRGDEKRAVPLVLAQLEGYEAAAGAWESDLLSL
eukprot:gene3379-4350_t